MAKRYWLKTSAHFFKDSHIIYLKSQKNGYEYIYLWQCLLLKSLEVDDETDCGFLRLNEKIPYSPELMSDIFGMNIDVVKAGVNLFVQLGMITILEDGTIYIESIQKMIGKETESAERVRKHREKLKMLQCNDDVTKCNTILIPILNTNNNKEKEKRIGFVKPSLTEIDTYINELNIKSFTSNKFFDFYESKGWMIGKNKMKDWKACVRTWRDKNNEKIKSLPELDNDLEARRKRSEEEIKKSRIEING